MLMQEFNIAGKYAGKQLGDIDLSELVFGSETGILTALDADQSANSDEAAPLNGFSEDEVKPDLQIVETFDEYEFQDDEKDRPTSKRKTATNRVTWTKEEVVEIEQYFKENLSTGTTPGLKECQKAIQMSLKNSGILQRRSWETLKKKVWNMIKIKRL